MLPALEEAACVRLPPPGDLADTGDAGPAIRRHRAYWPALRRMNARDPVQFYGAPEAAIRPASRTLSDRRDAEPVGQKAAAHCAFAQPATAAKARQAVFLRSAAQLHVDGYPPLERAGAALGTAQAAAGLSRFRTAPTGWRVPVGRQPAARPTLGGRQQRASAAPPSPLHHRRCPAGLLAFRPLSARAGAGHLTGWVRRNAGAARTFRSRIERACCSTGLDSLMSHELSRNIDQALRIRFTRRTSSWPMDRFAAAAILLDRLGNSPAGWKVDVGSRPAKLRHRPR